MGQCKLSPVLQFLAIAFLGCSSAGVAGAAEINDRMSIVEAIESVREQGFDVSYSSLLVEPWMRVRFTPEDTDPLHALQQVIAEYDLALEESPGPGWLIVRGERPVNPRTFAVRGRIIDASSGAPVAGARVTVAGRQIVSGADGVFEITDLSGSNRNLQIVADGYVSLRRELANPDTASGNVFALERVTLPNLEEITIVASRYSVFSSDGASSQFLSGDEIRLLPHVADDAFRVLHKLPGVASSDFQAPFNLRGGASDEVKIVIAGLELFEPYHMRTLYSPLSIIDPGIIGQAQMLSGGFTRLRRRLVPYLSQGILDSAEIDMLVESASELELATPRLLHMDFRPVNMLARVVDGSIEITGLVDAANCLAGDAALDVARLDEGEGVDDHFLAGYSQIADSVDRGSAAYALYRLETAALLAAVYRGSPEAAVRERRLLETKDTALASP